MAEQYPPETVDRIVERLAEGRSLRAICAEQGMPGRTTVYRWLHADDELGARMREAREIGFTDYAEETMDLVANEKDAIKARVVLDSRRWFLGKLSHAFAEKPVTIGVAVNVDAASDFGAFADALEGVAADRARLAGSTVRVGAESPAGSVDPTGGLARLAGPGREGLGED